MSFQLYHLRSQSMALVKERDVADDEAFYRGAPLIENGDGEYEEVDGGNYAYAGPVHGIALARYGMDGQDMYEGAPSFDILGGFGIPPGVMQAIYVEQGNRKLVFSARFVGDVPVDLAIGDTFGIIRDVDNWWKVNFADTGGAMVMIEDLRWMQHPINKNRVVVSFAEAPGGD